MTRPDYTANPRIRWRKSSYSGHANQCVEVAHFGDACAVRDSKDPGEPLVFTVAGWKAFLQAVKRGAYGR